MRSPVHPQLFAASRRGAALLSVTRFRTALLGLALLGATLSGPGMARAAIVSAAPQEVSVAIYRWQPQLTSDLDDIDEMDEGDASGGVAMITELRTVDLPAGESIVEFQGVSSLIVPQTAKLEEAGTVLEANFDYRLLGPGEIIASSLGETVRVVRTDPSTGRVTATDAMLLSGPEGVMLKSEQGIEALGCSGAIEHLVFDRIPPALTDKPTLSAKVRPLRPGRHTLRLTYLTLGLNWSADYVARINADGKTLSLFGWVTLANRQSTRFADATVQVIAGNIAFDPEETAPPEQRVRTQQYRCWPIGRFWSALPQRRDGGQEMLQSVPMAVQRLSKDLEEVVVTAHKREAVLSELGDYKLYSLPERTHVNARQVKQVQLMDVDRVPFERVYSQVIAFEDLNTGTGPQPLRATSLIRIQNDKSSNLGKPIPAGAISVMDAGKNRAILTGETRLGDQPVGQPIDITLGEALDVWILPSAIQERECGFWRRRTTCADIDVTAINGKAAPITVELYLRLTEDSEYSIVSAPAGKRFKHGMPYWTVALAPGERKVLRYTVKETD